MNPIVEVKAFNPVLDGKLVSVMGGRWNRYFFVTNVYPDELKLVNDAGSITTLEMEEISKHHIEIKVIELPEL